MARVWTGSRSRTSYLRRLAIVFADELRLKIVTELYMREMSPSRFFAEFGGGSVSRVDRHFKRLAEHGWLRPVREESGGRRRGATEHFFRATELAIFDDETWAQVPYSVRVAFSWRTFKQLAERVRQALEAGTLDSLAGHRVQQAAVRLDATGWERVLKAYEALFGELFDEQEDAKVRMLHTGEDPILVTIGLAFFESAPGGSGPRFPGLVEGRESAVPFPVRFSKVLADSLCMKILNEANRREISAPQFHEEFGGVPVDVVRRRFRMLAEIEWLRKTGEESGGKRRGAVERFYRATAPAIWGGDGWIDPSAPVAATDGWQSFERLSDGVKEAVGCGVLEARIDTHLSWSLVRLDRLGWENFGAGLAELDRVVAEEQEATVTRTVRTGESPVEATVASLAFESPQDPIKAP